MKEMSKIPIKEDEGTVVKIYLSSVSNSPVIFSVHSANNQINNGNENIVLEYKEPKW